MHFLNPIWLFAIAAVVIPVAIHLWNIRPGKVLKVGSISLMEAASRKSSRSFSILDVLLLLLRCLLLVLLAMLLAVPLWHKKLEPNKAKGWVMLPKENLKSGYQHFKTSIDSLTNAGFEFHYFNTGFTETDPKQVLAHPKDSLATADTIPGNFWNLAAQLDTTVSSTLPIYVFTPNQAGYFTGLKPQVALNLHWKTYTPADSTASWVQDAWFNNNNTIRVVVGNSTPSGTTYSYTNIQSGDQGNSPFLVNLNNGRATVSLKTGNHQQINVDTSTLKLAIYTDNQADAGYLNAALQSVSQFMQRKTIIKQYSNANDITANQSWVFWLSEKPLPVTLRQQSRHVLQYEKGRIIALNSWLNNNGSFSVATQQGQKVGLYKLIEPSAKNQSALWRDGFGHAVLTHENGTDSKIYHFYSRFKPTWNDLVWSDEFPSWLLKLMVADKDATVLAKNEKTVLDNKQIMPGSLTQNHMVAVKTAGLLNISNYCWLVLALLFLAERWLANRTQNIKTNG